MLLVVKKEGKKTVQCIFSGPCYECQFFVLFILSNNKSINICCICNKLMEYDFHSICSDTKVLVVINITDDDDGFRTWYIYIYIFMKQIDLLLNTNEA